MPSKKSKSKDKNKKIRKHNKSIHIDNLNVIRDKIDDIDKKIHNLIIKRSDYIKNVVKEKLKISKDSLVIYRPAREYEVLTRILHRHKGDFPKEVLITIWRTMIGASISIQGNLQISYSSSLEKLVKEYFGITMKYNKILNIRKSFDYLKSSPNHLLVLPYPNNKSNWWVTLLSIKNVNIISNLYDNLFENPKGVILGSQEVEYTKNNQVIYIVSINKDNKNLFEKYMSINNYSILSTSNVKDKAVIFLFSVNIKNNNEAVKKLDTFKNKKFIEGKNIRIVGVVPHIEKKEIYG